MNSKEVRRTRRVRRLTSVWLLLAMWLLLFTGCGKKETQLPVQAQAPADSSVQIEVYDAEPGDIQVTESAGAAAKIPDVGEAGGIPDAGEAGGIPDVGETSGISDTAEETAGEPDTAEEAALDEHGSYTTKEDVSLYLHTYGRLPDNFITKKQAQKLGWQGGSLEHYAPGKCIGGDYFGNYEGRLPKDKKYRECDIGTLGKKKRGVKRIIYSDDGDIYYTEDHYETFERLY